MQNFSSVPQWKTVIVTLSSNVDLGHWFSSAVIRVTESIDPNENEGLWPLRCQSHFTFSG